jgi:hypothetical protein
MCGNKPIESYPCCPVPEVVASVFKAKNGSVALIVANIANVPVDYAATVDLGERAGYTRSRRYTTVAISILPTSARVVLLPTATTTETLSL